MNKKIQIAYIVNARIPTEKAHGYQITQMCSEFARAGAEATLYVPQRANPIEKDIFSYYGVDKNFEVAYVPCFDTVRFAWLLGPATFILQTKLFLRAMKRLQIPPEAIIYSRNPEVVSAYSKQGHRTVYDAHNFPEKSEKLMRDIAGVSAIVANSSGTAEEFKKRGFGRVLVAPNGVDIAAFNVMGDRASFRREFGLPENARIAMYVGHLYPWKGVDTVIAAAGIAKNVTFAFAGGTADDIKKYEKIIKEKGLSNVVLLGHRERKDIPKLIKASDVVLLPNAPASKESEKYTSPLKMFEYMASGTPIVASDLPSIREILSDDTSWFFGAGNAEALAAAVEKSFGSPSISQAKAQAARSAVLRYSWEARAKAILNFIAG